MTRIGVTHPSRDGRGRPASVPGGLHTQAENRRLIDEREAALLELQRTRAVNTLLRSELDTSMNELRDSRARLMSAAVQERRRIERDLHDGAQQRLVAAQVRLGLARDILSDEPRRGEKLLDLLCVDLEDALDELRSLAHGLYPAALSDRGIAAALLDAARHSPLAVTVDPDGAERYSPEIESAVYFCCLESLQNAAKHAEGATDVSISLAADDQLSFEVTDNGRGFAPGADPSAGAGLTNMRDRLAAVGGRLEVRSGRRRGTCVTGTIPLAEDA